MKSRGVTLIELVVALSLSALLMVALSGVLSSLTRQEKSFATREPNSWQHSLDRLLWNDLSQASGVALDEGILWLTAPSPLPRVSSADVSIAYRLKPWKNDSLRLVRVVYDGSQLNRGKLILEQTLIWDVRHAMFERIDDLGNDQPFPTRIGPAPRAFHYRLTLGKSGDQIDQKILVR